MSSIYREQNGVGTLVSIVGGPLAPLILDVAEAVRAARADQRAHEVQRIELEGRLTLEREQQRREAEVAIERIRAGRDVLVSMPKESLSAEEKARIVDAALDLLGTR